MPGAAKRRRSAAARDPGAPGGRCGAERARAARGVRGRSDGLPVPPHQAHAGAIAHPRLADAEPAPVGTRLVILPVDVSPIDPPESDSTRPSAHSTRATVLFADIVGFTELSAEVGPEARVPRGERCAPAAGRRRAPPRRLRRQVPGRRADGRLRASRAARRARPRRRPRGARDARAAARVRPRPPGPARPRGRHQHGPARRGRRSRAA